ncbi:MAG: DUF6252 family protein [Chitinophaga rupis]
MRLVKILAFAGALSLSACQKSAVLDNSIIGSIDSTGLFSALIDNQPWIASDSSRFASIMNGKITLSGSGGDDDQTLVISLNDTVPGKYVLGWKQISVAEYTTRYMWDQYYGTDKSSNANLNGGEVEVTTIDKNKKTITGTFTLNLYNDSANRTVHMTKGTFKDISYITALPLASATDTFRVQIDGVDWTAQSISTGIVAGELLVKGAELDNTRSVGLYMPPNPVAGIYYDSWPDYAWGTYSNNGQSWSSFSYSPFGNGVVLIHTALGFTHVIENNTASHRLRANFDMALTPALGGTDTLQLNKGYFSVHY